MRDTGSGLCQQRQFLIVKMDSMCVPHIISDPIHVCHVGQRTLPIFFKYVVFFIYGLTQMGMQPYSQVTRQDSGLPIELLAGAERRAGCQRHHFHGKRSRVVVLFHRIAGIL